VPASPSDGDFFYTIRDRPIIYVMHIDSSHVRMSSARSYSERTESRTDVRTWGRTGINRPHAPDVPHSPKPAGNKQRNESEAYSGQILFIIKLIETLTGKKVKIINPMSDSPSPMSGSWGIEINRTETHTEGENTVYSAEGSVTTEAGETISFSLDLQMTRQFTASGTFSFRAGTVADPLVINFSGSPVTLTEDKFGFDLNADGLNEQISFVGTGSGFLFLDRNGDGVATDGSELFGPMTSNGFADLARLDVDGNGWIDENDAAFKNLRVWTRDPAGTDVYRGLGDTGVGALYTGSIDTGFSIKDAENNDLGRVNRSGLYLKDNGTAGILQKIDLAI